MNLPDFIRQNIEVILQEWENHAFAIQPENGSMDKEELRDHAEKILLDIADGIDRGRNKQFRDERSRGMHPLLGKKLRSAHQHGITRNGFGFTINDVLSEYRALRTSVIRLWGESRQKNPAWDEILLFNEELDGVVKEAVEAFAAESVKQRRLLEKAITSSWDHCYLLNDNGRFIYANTSLLNDLNITNSALMGMTHNDIQLHDSERLYQEAMKVLASGEKRSGEVTYSPSSGEEKVYEYVYEPIILDDQKTIEGVVALERDVTEQRHVHNIIKHNEKILALIFENLPVGICLLNSKGKVIHSNDKMQSLVPEMIPSLDPERKKRWRASHDDGQPIPRVEWPGACALRGETVVPGIEFIYTDDDGSDYYMLVSAVPLPKDGDRHARALVVIQDITERKELETHLVQSQKMESIGRLAGGVAHDYNNMLSVILGYTELALEKVDPTTSLHNDLNEVQRAAKRSVDITGQLLAFARKQPVIPKIVDLNNIIENMLNMLKHLIGENIELNWSPAETLWEIKIDPAQVDQILANLCVNARDAITDNGTIAIETKNVELDEDYSKVHKEISPGEYVMISISDNGIGMDKDIIENIFEPFYTTKDIGQGTGLGLSTLYGIVQQNNGLINVYSEPGIGTIFKIYLPRHVEELIEKTNSILSDADLIGRETILLVEDESSIRKMACTMLDRLGYQVLSAESPSQAIEIAEKEADNIKILITDVVMPEMNGRELSEQIRSVCKDIKTLFMSGYTKDIIAKNGVIDDVKNFIQKPFSKNELGEKIKDICLQ